MCDDYKRYVCSKYGECIVVSDVYTDGPTVKDKTHQRRGQTNYVQILEAMGCQVIHATGDAAFLIAQTAADNMTVVMLLFWLLKRLPTTWQLLLLLTTLMYWFCYVITIGMSARHFISSPKHNVDLSTLEYGTFEPEELLLVWFYVNTCPSCMHFLAAIPHHDPLELEKKVALKKWVNWSSMQEYFSILILQKKNRISRWKSNSSSL